LFDRPLFTDFRFGPFIEDLVIKGEEKMDSKKGISDELAAHFKSVEEAHRAYVEALQGLKRGEPDQEISRDPDSRRSREFKRRVRIRNMDQTTQIEAIGSLGILDLKIKSKSLSVQQRRLIGVTFIRQIRPWLNFFTTLNLRHWDHMKNHWCTGNYGIPVFKALPLDTPTGKFGAEIRMRRLQRGWTQRELAKKAGVGSCHLSEIERGLRRPRKRTFERLEVALEAAL
jgi:DNA-binding XRE family transcriptional regulator